MPFHGFVAHANAVSRVLEVIMGIHWVNVKNIVRIICKINNRWHCGSTILTFNYSFRLTLLLFTLLLFENIWRQRIMPVNQCWRLSGRQHNNHNILTNDIRPCTHSVFISTPPPPQGLMLYLILDEVPMFPNSQTRDTPPHVWDSYFRFGIKAMIVIIIMTYL